MALAAMVQRTRNELLAGAVLARDQHRGRRARRALDHRQHLLHRHTRADEVLRLEARARLAPQRQVLAHQLLVGALHLLVAAALLDRHRHQVREALEQAAVGGVERAGAPRVVEVDSAGSLGASLTSRLPPLRATRSTTRRL